MYTQRQFQAMAKIKVGILCNIVVPYTIPVFNHLAQSDDIELEVMYIAKTAPNRIWDAQKMVESMKYKHTFLSGIKLMFRLKNELVQYVLNPTYVFDLYQRKYDVVITYGWFDFSCQLTGVFHRLMGYKHIVWSDSTLAESSLGRRLTEWFVRWFVQQADGCIASGVNAKEYFLHLGVKEKNITIVPNTVNTDVLSKQIAQSKKRAAEIRKQHKIPLDNKIILYVGQFIHRKGVDVLLRAFKKLHDSHATLLLVGYGEDLDIYKAMIATLGIERVQIISGESKNNVADYYALADCFVLPSREETWGLVVNEALSAGVPVVVSDRVGSGADLVIEGKTGYIFQSENVDQLADRLATCLSNKEVRKNKKVFEDVLGRFRPENVADQMKKAIHAAL